LGQLLSQGPLFIVCLVFMMGIVVIIHELGHYLMGRLFGAAVESFSVGFGRPVFERKDKVGTRWRVNWIPLGGFVKFVGESQLAGDVGKVEQGPVGKAYKNLTVWQRMLVSLAGPLANFVLASLIFSLILGTHGRTNYSVGISAVVADSPAERGGMQAGDAFVSVNGHPVTDASSITIPIMLNPNEEMTFEMLRDGAPVTLKVTPDEVVRKNEFGQMVPQATIGIGMAPIALGERIKYNPVQALGAGVVETGATIDRTVTMLSRIVTGKMSVHTMTGPVGIGDISRRVVNKVWEQPDVSQTAKLEQLFWMLLSICAAISVGVGFFNLLPLPVLDGGHLVFHAYEAIVGRELPEKVQEMSLTFGLILLLGMVVVITWGDIMETGLFGGTGG
jgi:regulator of sigma E protease|tara:strand:- start:45285 stop:46454 length:1170 start_codon:yes stop_codon:yes gene_type:complete